MDVVYVTVASGELVALALDKGQVKWKYKVELGFGESSPAVAAGKVFVGDLGGVVSRRQRRRRQGGVDASRPGARSSPRRSSSATSC